MSVPQSFTRRFDQPRIVTSSYLPQAYMKNTTNGH